MSIKSWFGKEERTARHKKIADYIKSKWDNVSDWFAEWWSNSGQKLTAEVIRNTIGVYISLYKDKLLEIVKNIALGITAPLYDGETKAAMFAREFKDLLDTNGDGELTYEDLPESVVNFLREYVVAIWKSLGSTDEERAAALG